MHRFLAGQARAPLTTKMTFGALERFGQPRPCSPLLSLPERLSSNVVVTKMDGHKKCNCRVRTRTPLTASL